MKGNAVPKRRTPQAQRQRAAPAPLSAAQSRQITEKGPQAAEAQRQVSEEIRQTTERLREAAEQHRMATEQHREDMVRQIALMQTRPQRIQAQAAEAVFQVNKLIRQAQLQAEACLPNAHSFLAP
jgi:hypothetical protein